MRASKMPLLAVLVFLGSPCLDHAAEAKWILRAGAGALSSSGKWKGDLPVEENAGISELEADGSGGPQAGLEYIFTNHFGGEFSLLRTTCIIDGSGVNFPRSRFAEVTGWPLLFSANFHLTRGKAFDLYAGPLIGFILWERMRTTDALDGFVDIGNIQMKRDFAWGVNLGFDVFFTRHWGFSLDLKEFDSGATTDSKAIRAVLGKDLKVPIRPVLASAGIGIRW